MNEQQITAAAEHIMEQIDQHECSSARVPPAVTIEFLETLEELIRERIALLREEFGTE